MAASFLQAANSTTDASSYTFTAQNLGTAASDRYIVVVVHGGLTTNSARTLSSVSVGGNAATIVQQINNLGYYGNHRLVAGLCIVAIPSGSSGDVVVTFSGAMGTCAIELWRADSLSSATPYSTASNFNGSGAAAVNLDVPVGFAVGAGVASYGGSATWTGLTKNYDAVMESPIYASGASIDITAAQTGRAISANMSSVGTVIVAASWAWATPSVERCRSWIIG